MDNTRKCPSCGKELAYVSEENCKSAEKRNGLCNKCAHGTSACRQKISLVHKGKKVSSASKKLMSDSHKGLHVGARNSMFGRTPYDIWIKKYGREEADRRKKDHDSRTGQPWAHDVARVDKQREVARNAHPGRSNYSLWLEKYGPEEAARRLNSSSEKQRLASSGSGNPMFGKPAPVGSGCGWSGWYRGQYFHSLLELTYMLLLDKEGTQWETGEQKGLATAYEWAGKTRNYFPDFIVGSTVVELKPKRLVNLGQNQAKFAAAAARWGDDFKVVTEKDIVKIQGEELKALCESGTVVLLDKWKARL